MRRANRSHYALFRRPDRPDLIDDDDDELPPLALAHRIDDDDMGLPALADSESDSISMRSDLDLPDLRIHMDDDEDDEYF